MRIGLPVFLSIVAVLLVCVVLYAQQDRGSTAAAKPLSASSSRSSTATITVHAAVVGTTTTYIGATEAGGFWIEDLDDLGINTYRLWTKMAELEWWDDDDAKAIPPWSCTAIGTPTITQIKADAVGGFANTVPWDWWDERFGDESWFSWVESDGPVSRTRILNELAANGITPVIVLRTRDDAGNPNCCGNWSPTPPVTDTFRNEWWEHCFAVAYWLNVRNDYGVTRFEVLNEPDYPGQGWAEDGGTVAEYVQLVLDAHDAISYANSLAGLPVHIHAPVVANHSSSYVAYTLDHADGAVQVVDYHDYSADVRPGVATISSTIASHNPDSIVEPVWNSEWGALWSTYDTFARGMTTAKQLLAFSEEGVEGVTVFNMYDWSTSAGQDYGLIDLQDDGGGGALRVRTESYYAYRLMVRGLIGGKERLQFETSGLSADTHVMITRGDTNVYAVVLQDGVGTRVTGTLDLSELGIGSGTATVFEYSADHKDEPVLSPTVASGVLTFTAPADGISLVVVARPDLSPSSKAVEPKTTRSGEMVTYTVVISNASAVGPASARLTDSLSISTTCIAGPWASSGEAGYTGGVVTWTGAVSATAPVVVTYQVAVTASVADGAVVSNVVFVDDGAGGQPNTPTAAFTVRWHRLYLPVVLQENRTAGEAANLVISNR